jgi:exonuclease V gamma subunit
MFMPWNPAKQEIEIWLETKQLKFAQKYNRSYRYTPRQYQQRYVFTDLHEAYLCYFPDLLQEWFLRLKD